MTKRDGLAETPGLPCQSKSAPKALSKAPSKSNSSQTLGGAANFLLFVIGVYVHKPKEGSLRLRQIDPFLAP